MHAFFTVMYSCRQVETQVTASCVSREDAAGLDAAELLAAWAELEVGGLPTRRQAVLGTQMILKPAALNRVSKLPALHH